MYNSLSPYNVLMLIFYDLTRQSSNKVVLENLLSMHISTCSWWVCIVDVHTSSRVLLLNDLLSQLILVLEDYTGILGWGTQMIAASIVNTDIWVENKVSVRLYHVLGMSLIPYQFWSVHLATTILAFLIHWLVSLVLIHIVGFSCISMLVVLTCNLDLINIEGFVC